MTMTAAELARRCGVSRGTVDRALNGRGGINAATEEKIRKLAEKYGYRPNPIGRALVSGRTMTIGVILFDFDHSFFAELYAALAREAEAFHYELLPLLSYGDPQRERECVARLAERRADGMVMLPVNRGPQFEAELRRTGIPVVCLCNRLGPQFPFTGVDERRAAREATDYLAAEGARQIYYYCPPLRHAGESNLMAQTERLAGYQEALLHDHRLHGEAAVDIGYLIGQLRCRRSAPAAILCSNDFHAMDLQLELRRELPGREIRLMGFDGLSVLKYAHPAIASVAFDRAAMAHAAFAQLQQGMAGDVAEDAVIPFTIQK